MDTEDWPQQSSRAASPTSKVPVSRHAHEQQRLTGRERRIGSRTSARRFAQGPHAGQSRIEHGAIKTMPHLEQDVFSAGRHAQQAAATVTRTYPLGNEIEANKVS